MGIKGVLIILGAFLIGAGASFVFLPRLQITTQKTITLPVDQTHRGVTSTILVYSFKGIVTEIKPAGDNFRLKLDLSDSETPDFITTPRTFVFILKDTGEPVKATVKDVKVGSSVTLSTTYDLNKKTWELNGITIK